MYITIIIEMYSLYIYRVQSTEYSMVITIGYIGYNIVVISLINEIITTLYILTLYLVQVIYWSTD